MHLTPLSRPTGYGTVSVARSLVKAGVLGSRQQQPQHRFRQILRAHPVTSTDCWKTTQDRSRRQVSPAADMATQEAFPVKHVWLYSSRSGGISAVQHVSFNIHAASVEGQIDAIRQSQQQLDQQHALNLQDLHSAKAEAQQADEASATLAAEVHQLQMEINAKQADCSRIKGELAKAVESRTAISHDMTSKRRQFISECQELDRQLRLLLEPRHSQDNPTCIAQK